MPIEQRVYLPNVIPQPAIRGISQRTGTNIVDLDFEILDSDDTTATVGILAYADGTRIVPQAWTDGTHQRSVCHLSHQSGAPGIMGRQAGLGHQYRYHQV